MEPPRHKLLYLLLMLFTLVRVARGRDRKCRTISAAFSLNQNGPTFFLSGREFIEYNFRYQSEARVGPTRLLGLDPSVTDIDAAFTDPNGTVYFLQGCSSFRYTKTNHPTKILRLVDHGNLTDLGLPCSVDAAVNLGGDISVLSGCDVWSMNPGTSTFQLNSSLVSQGLPCEINAAVEWNGSEVIYIKGSQYWTLGDRLQGPFHTDNLHLCSWYLCGEADWMGDRPPQITRCNGDRRFCDLRLDQMTLAGLHNAGSGFNGGFWLLDCLLRNHAENISTQLENGIRHLDIDPCFDTCGLLGTCHTSWCGGSICHVIKQVRAFLGRHPLEVVTINFNHEIVQPERVLPALTRQLQTQLGPMLNTQFRRRHQTIWPTLRQSIRTNKRVFIFYAPIIEQKPYVKIYRRHKWIINENVYGSTWRPFSVSAGCQEVVPLTAERCHVRQDRHLVEVSIIPESGACISTMADMCRQYLHDSLLACEPFRLAYQKSPNVLLVDYPEVAAQSVASAFHAVYHQNLRNVINHRSNKCEVKVDAAIKLPGTDQVLFFVADKIHVYSLQERAQVHSRELPQGVSAIVDAVYLDAANTNVLKILKGCDVLEVNVQDLDQMSAVNSSLMTPCFPVDDVMTWQAQLYTFKGCHVTPEGFEPIHLSKWRMPCYIDVALVIEDIVTVFKGNQYWQFSSPGNITKEGKTLGWRIDAVQCRH